METRRCLACQVRTSCSSTFWTDAGWIGAHSATKTRLRVISERRWAIFYGQREIVEQLSGSLFPFVLFLGGYEVVIRGSR
mmetsp:Transcript_15647/g.33035  ORF Transcript_15647/g.33035 Transcript_15647/m.33035 type:complete len:80 (+) Transcript_15647:1102-1341(+)